MNEIDQLLASAIVSFFEKALIALGFPMQSSPAYSGSSKLVFNPVDDSFVLTLTWTPLPYKTSEAPKEILR